MQLGIRNKQEYATNDFSNDDTKYNSCVEMLGLLK